MGISNFYQYQLESPLRYPSKYCNNLNDHHQLNVYGNQTGPWNLVPVTAVVTLGTGPGKTQNTGYPASQNLPGPSALNDTNAADSAADQPPNFSWPQVWLMGPPFDSASDPSVAPNGALNLQVSLFSDVDSAGNKWVMISLAPGTYTSGSTFSPAGSQKILWGNADDTSSQNPANDKHGFYTQEVVVEISPDPNVPTSAGLTGTGAVPSTQMGSTTDSSSSSATIQILGLHPGAGASAQSGSSVTLTDFTWVDHSTGTLVKTVYSIADFPEPKDLLHDYPPYDLQDLPSTAIGNLKIPTQGQWMADGGFTGTVIFTVSLTATVVYIEKTFDGINATTQTQVVVAQRNFTIPVNFGSVIPTSSSS